ncbi:MAG: hypothetical protein GY833_16605 [Aestuariibacter sp.]|nr:hypothetical protein [Aestuariibacter sp.]
MTAEDKLSAEVARLAAITDRLEEAVKESRAFDVQFADKCAARHSQVQRDLGNITGRATVFSLFVAFLVSLISGVIAYLVRN